MENLKVLVAIRSNIFTQLGFEKYARGQEEKYTAKTLNIRWTKKDLIALLSQRAIVACKAHNIEISNGIQGLLPEHDSTNDSDPLDYIIDKTLMKPRDAIQFLNMAAREAAGSDRITWDDIYLAEKEYSKSRLSALRDEWKDPYIGIDQLFENLAWFISEPKYLNN